LHISKIRFLFPVSFTIEYNVGIAEFYLYVGFGADQLKNMVTQSLKAAEIRFHTPRNWQTTSGLSHKKTGVDATTCFCRRKVDIEFTATTSVGVSE